MFAPHFVRKPQRTQTPAARFAPLLAGYFGPAEPAGLRLLLGDQAQIHAGLGFALGLRAGHGEPASLSITPDGVSATIGLAAELGLSATISREGRELALRRDCFGLHSLYTRRLGRTWWFASDFNSLLRLPPIPRTLDPAALHAYLCFSYVPTPNTLVAGVGALAAGECLVIDADGRVRRANQADWCEQAGGPASEALAADQLREWLVAAVSGQLGGAHEVAVFLSGGLDSSLIAAVLVELGVQVHLLHLDFGPPYDLETRYALQAAAHLRRPLHLVAAGARQVAAALSPTAAALHQPFGDGVTVPLFLLCQAAAQHAAVAFCGEGGDQAFGGWANKPMIAAQLYGQNGFNREAAYLLTFHRLLGLHEHFYTARARQLVHGLDVGAWVRPALDAPGFSSLLHRLRAANLWLKGAQNIAPRLTQLAAAQGVAVRMPYFDLGLTRWSFSLPPETLLRGACEKYLLKRVAEQYLPPAVVWRDKRGMGVPTTEWCLGDLRGEVARRLDGRRLARAGWFQPKAVQQLRSGQEHSGDPRRRRVGEHLWLLLMLHLWMDVHGQALVWPTIDGSGQ